MDLSNQSAIVTGGASGLGHATARRLADAGAAVVDGPDPERHGDDDARHPGWDVALAWLKAADSELVQAFVGVARGRRGASSR